MPLPTKCSVIAMGDSCYGHCSKIAPISVGVKKPYMITLACWPHVYVTAVSDHVSLIGEMISDNPRELMRELMMERIGGQYTMVLDSLYTDQTTTLDHQIVN